MSRHWTWRLYTAVLLILLALGASSAFAFGPGSPLTNKPYWTLHGATLDAEDTHKRYAIGRTFASPLALFSNSRASDRWADDANGVYQVAPALTTNIQSGKGALLAEARTNKCTNYNANPTNTTGIVGGGGSTFSVVAYADLPAAVKSAFAPFVNIASAAIHVTGGVGASITFSGSVGNTNAHSFAINGYVVSGSATMSLTATEGSVALSSNFLRTVSSNVTPTATNRQLRITLGEVGTDIYVILNELQEATFLIDSPVVVAGSSAAVGADIRQLIGPAATAALAAKGAYFETDASAGGTNPTLMAFSGGATLFFPGTTTARITDGTNTASATFGSGSSAGIAKTAFGIALPGSSVIANGGAKGTNGTFDLTNTGTIRYGNTSGGNRALNGLARRITFSNRFGQFDNLTRVP